MSEINIAAYQWRSDGTNARPVNPILSNNNGDNLTDKEVGQYNEYQLLISNVIYPTDAPTGIYKGEDFEPPVWQYLHDGTQHWINCNENAAKMVQYKTRQFLRYIGQPAAKEPVRNSGFDIAIAIEPDKTKWPPFVKYLSSKTPTAEDIEWAKDKIAKYKEPVKVGGETAELLLENCFPVIGQMGSVGWHQIGRENQLDFINAMEVYVAQQNDTNVEALKAIITRMQNTFDENGFGLPLDIQLQRIEQHALTAIEIHSNDNKALKAENERLREALVAIGTHNFSAEHCRNLATAALNQKD